MVEGLDFEVTQSDDSAVVAIAGEVDFASAPELAGVLAELDQLRVTVDLSGVTFLDSAGLNTLVQAREQIRKRGGTLTVQGASPMVRKTFEITGLHDLFFG